MDSLRQERDQGMYGGPRGGHQQGGPPPPQGGPPHPHGGGYESDQGRVKVTSKWDVAVSTTGRNTMDFFVKIVCLDVNSTVTCRYSIIMYAWQLL